MTAQSNTVDNQAPPGPIREFWLYFRENRGAVAGFVLFVLICLMALLADFIGPQSPSLQYRESFLQPPFWA